MNFKKRVNDSWTNTPHYIHKTDTDTLTTLPAVLYPTGSTATVGLKGQAVQSTAPTPDSPVMPNGTGERTNNLADFIAPVYSYDDFYAVNTLETVKTKQNCIYLPAGDYVLYGNNTSAKFLIKAFTENGAITDQTADTMSGESLISHYPSQSWFYLTYFSGNKYWSFGSDLDLTKGITVTLGQPSWLLIVTNQGKTVTEFSITAGNTLQPYEPYGIKTPISSAGQTTPVYLGEVQTTRKIKKLVLTGDETFIFVSSDSNRTVCFMLITNCIGNFGFCTHIEWKQQYQNTEYDRLVWNTHYGGILYISLSNIYLSSQTATAFKDYLAQQYANGTPVTIWYVLATPETAVVNEPLMKIAGYADEVSNVSIPVTAGGDTISVGTTIQPSEVTANYHGWHPVADVHERTNGAWT